MTRVFLAVSLVVSIFLSFACVQKGGNGTTADTGNTIRIGVYGDTTGATSSFGGSTQIGIELGFCEINAAGGVNGKKLEMVFEDDQGTPEKAKTVISKLINQDKVVAVLGEVASSNSLAAAPVAQEAKIPMITPSSTNPKVTEVGDYISRVCFIDPFQGTVMSKFALSRGWKKVAVLTGVKQDYAVGLAEFFKKHYTANGGEIVKEQNYSTGDKDFKAQLTSIQGA